MRRNNGIGGQGLLGNAPMGFGNQNSVFSNKGFGNSLPGFGNLRGTQMNAPVDSQPGFGKMHNPMQNDFSGKRFPDFGSGNCNSSGFNGNNGSFDNNGLAEQQFGNKGSLHRIGGMLPIQQQQQQSQLQQQSHQSMASVGLGSTNNSLLNSQQKMSQIFNSDTDTQLALVNNLLKGSLIPNKNKMAMNVQQQQQHQQNQNMQSPNGHVNNMQSMNNVGMNHPNQVNPIGMNPHQSMNGINMSMNGLQVDSSAMPMNNNGNVGMGSHMGSQGQYGGPMAVGLNSGRIGNMGMTSPGGHSILGIPKGPQGLLGKSQGLLGNTQGLLGIHQSLLGNPSLPRNPDFMHRNSGALVGRSNSNSRGNVQSPRGNSQGYNGQQNHNRQNRSNQHNRGRSEKRAPNTNNNNDRRRRHDSRDSQDSHDSRDGRHRHSHDRRDISSKRDDSRNEYTEKRQVALAAGAGCELLRVSISDGQEEYDPAEPTEDNAESNATSESGLLVEADRDLESPGVTASSYRTGQKRPRSHSPISRSHTTSGDLKVTVDEKGRSVQDGPSKPKSRRESTGSDVKDGEDQKLTCHACSVDCKDIQHFESHMRSARHRARMESIRNLHVQKTDQQLARMRAEEHLRRIEGREKEDYCRICDKRFVGSFITHRRGQEHRRKERLTKRGCKLCRTGSFVQYCEYVKHIDGEPHKKNKEALRKQEQNSNQSRGDDDDDDAESFPDSFEELVTVDATGIYKSDEHDENAKPINVKQEKEEPSVQPPPKPCLLDEVKRKEERPIPSYDPDVAIGQEHIVPVKGFFCKLCQKFYMNKSAALTTHSRSNAHFDKYIEYQKRKTDDGECSSTTKISTETNPETQNSCQNYSENKTALLQNCAELSNAKATDQNEEDSENNSAEDTAKVDENEYFHEALFEIDDEQQMVDNISTKATSTDPLQEQNSIDDSGLLPIPNGTLVESIVNGNNESENETYVNGSEVGPLHKESNGDVLDQENNIDDDVTSVEIKVGKAAERKSPRTRRGRARRGRAK